VSNTAEDPFDFKKLNYELCTDLQKLDNFVKCYIVTVFIKHALLALSLRFRALEGVLVFAKPSPDLSKSQNPPQHNLGSSELRRSERC